jgi:stage II sporulation protein D (peptidoglycan lytic transglycosylase)
MLARDSLARCSASPLGDNLECGVFHPSRAARLGTPGSTPLWSAAARRRFSAPHHDTVHLTNASAPKNGWVSFKPLFLLATVICVVAFLATITLSSRSYSLFSASSAESVYEDDLDRRLAQAATAALGDRRGTIIVMDPQTGRVRAVVNPEIAFAESLPPGSTIKPFSALAAMKSGLIDETSQTLCREKYTHEGFQTVCSHPRELAPMNPTEAIAYSCNYYFGKVGERLDESTFDSTLTEFGFGKSTGINSAVEAQGRIPRKAWHSQNAIGETDELQATPIQLLDAYAALINGGRLFTPQVASARGYVPQLRAKVAIKDEYRNQIVNGMRGAVRYGTAETAGLYSLPAYIFGKTGTATQINGFRSQGWFVGFAAPLSSVGSSPQESSKAEHESAPENVKLAVLVFVARAHGSEAAQVARPVFEEYARITTEKLRPMQAVDSGGTENASEVHRSSISPHPSASATQVSVHLVRENITRKMSVEDYVLGVVAAEGSTEREPEALKALAIASRTYALKNIARHSSDGYDFCTTTHCQRFRVVDSESTSPVSEAVIEAVRATKGEVILDAGNQVADSYFSASCGGATANMKTLWGGQAPTYLRGLTDEFCKNDPHHNWIDVISVQQLLRATQSDPRTNVGNRLDAIRVFRQDASGRAELIAIEGEHRVIVKGWDFKIIVGRVLGWNLLKSSRFQISRSGSNFVFHGSGFGHGLGLCQEGAHVMAMRGANYRQILGKYFPGTTVHLVESSRSDVSTLDGAFYSSHPEQRPSETARPLRTFADLLWHDYEGFTVRPREAGATRRLTLSSEDFRINYPATLQKREIDALLRFLQASSGSLTARVSSAGINGQFPSLEVFINETTGDFVGRTGQPPWAAAATKGNRIELQPLQTLRRRRILETTLRHELVHALVDRLGHGRTPRWLAEGLAIHLAGEGQMVARYPPRVGLSTEEIEKQLRNAKSANDMKVAYAAAYSEVKRMIHNEGEANVWRRVAN